MPPTSDDTERWDAWCRSYDDVYQEMLTLFHTRWLWRTIIEMLQHSDVKQYVTVQNYLLRTYVGTVCTAIRREADRDSRTTSLARCLQMLIDCPHFSTRTRFRELLDTTTAPELAEERARRGFEQFARSGQETLDVSMIQADLESLQNAAGPVKKYTDKVIAHRENTHGGTKRVNVSFDQINDALDVIGDLTKRYYSLRHPGVMLANLTPSMDLNFLTMFQRPWYKDGFRPPDPFEMG
jgi:hypothetical protein